MAKETLHDELTLDRTYGVASSPAVSLTTSLDSRLEVDAAGLFECAEALGEFGHRAPRIGARVCLTG